MAGRFEIHQSYLSSVVIYLLSESTLEECSGMILSSTEIVNPTNNNSTFFKTSKAPPPKKPPKLSLKTSRKKVFEYCIQVIPERSQHKNFTRKISKISSQKFRIAIKRNLILTRKEKKEYHTNF